MVSQTNIEKLLIITPALTMGGMERASVNFANSIAKKGKEVYLVVVFKKNHFFEIDKRVKIIEPENFNISKLSIFKTIKFIRNSILEINPITTIVIGQFYGALTMLGAIGLKNNVYISERSSPLLKWPLRQRIVNRLSYWLKSPDGIIAQTNIAKSYQQKYYGKKVKIEVIPNPLRKIKLYPQIVRENNILAVGRFNDPLKGFDLLIESFALLKDTGWRLVFAGGDEEGEDLKKLADEYGVLDKIKFLGKVKNIDEVYARAGMLVMPSRSEGFPNALCEAMAAGLPVVSFDFVAGPRDIITHNVNGVIVENGNTKQLAFAIESLIENPLLRIELGEEAKKIKSKYDSDFICEQLLAFTL